MKTPTVTISSSKLLRLPAATTRRMIIPGIDWRASLIQVATRSKTPPKYPAATPDGTPMTSAVTIVMSAPHSVVLVP